MADKNEKITIDYPLAEELSECFQLDSRRYDSAVKEDE